MGCEIKQELKNNSYILVISFTWLRKCWNLLMDKKNVILDMLWCLMYADAKCKYQVCNQRKIFITHWWGQIYN